MYCKYIVNIVICPCLCEVSRHDTLFVYIVIAADVDVVVCPDIVTPFVSAVKEDASRDLDQCLWTGWI